MTSWTSSFDIADLTRDVADLMHEVADVIDEVLDVIDEVRDMNDDVNDVIDEVIDPISGTIGGASSTTPGGMRLHVADKATGMGEAAPPPRPGYSDRRFSRLRRLAGEAARKRASRVSSSWLCAVFAASRVPSLTYRLIAPRIFGAAYASSIR